MELSLEYVVLNVLSSFKWILESVLLIYIKLLDKNKFLKTSKKLVVFFG